MRPLTLMIDAVHPLSNIILNWRDYIIIESTTKINIWVIYRANCR